jgi:hypothetical protein
LLNKTIKRPYMMRESPSPEWKNREMPFALSLLIILG